MGGLGRVAAWLRSGGAPEVPLEPITLDVIGVVRSRLRSLRYRDMSNQRAEIRVSHRYTPGLAGLDGFSHAIVLTWLHQVADDERMLLRGRPSGLASTPVVGVFAMRTHHRPNPIGMTVVRIDRVDGGTVHVTGLDVIDGTPVLDIKPYLPPYDGVADARMPGWVTGEQG